MSHMNITCCATSGELSFQFQNDVRIPTPYLIGPFRQKPPDYLLCSALDSYDWLDLYVKFYWVMTKTGKKVVIKKHSKLFLLTVDSVIKSFQSHAANEACFFKNMQ